MRIAILGGGQLAKMTAQAASQLGIETLIWALEEGLPASQAATRSVIGPLEDPRIQSKIIEESDVITLESEFISGRLLHALQARGGRLLPTPEAVEIVQDKWTQKAALLAHGLPVSPGMAIADLESALQAGESLGYPLVIKTRRLGYDGHGTFKVNSPLDLRTLVGRLRPERHALMAESSIPFVRELSVVVTRAPDQRRVSYDPVETRQPQFVCEEVLAPAELSPTTRAFATTVAEAAAEALNLSGTLAVEMFLLPDGAVVINEIAPRPHNSGHFSIEACHTSQFENHVRAVAGLPLGSPTMILPAAVMVNILGSSERTISPADLVPALKVAGTHVHWYGKALSRPMRKLGHITALAGTIPEAQERAWRARRALDF